MRVFVCKGERFRGVNQVGIPIAKYLLLIKHFNKRRKEKMKSSKKRNFEKKLNLIKITISNLDAKVLNEIRGGTIRMTDGPGCILSSCCTQ